MVVPTNTTVVLEITASDVIHSWWIPKLGGKADAVPGYVNKTWFKIPRGKEGAYTRPVRRAVRRRTTPTCAAAVSAVSPERVRGLGRRQRERHQGGRRGARRAAQARAKARGAE